MRVIINGEPHEIEGNAVKLVIESDNPIDIEMTIAPPEDGRLIPLCQKLIQKQIGFAEFKAKVREVT